MEHSLGGGLGVCKSGCKACKGDTTLAASTEVHKVGNDGGRDSEHEEIQRSEEQSGRGKWGAPRKPRRADGSELGLRRSSRSTQRLRG
jgi:hypothetical protein